MPPVIVSTAASQPVCGPSFETPACGGLLGMKGLFAAKSQKFMVRARPSRASPDDALHRLERHQARQRQRRQTGCEISMARITAVLASRLGGVACGGVWG